MVTLQPMSRLVESPARDAGTESLPVAMDAVRGSLHGVIVIVAGATQGIGSAIAGELGTAGALVVVGHAGGSAVARSLGSAARAAGAQGICVDADVAGQIEAGTLIARTVRTFGRIDLLVTIAPITPASVTATRDEAWDIDVTADLARCLVPMKVALPYFVAQSGGAMVNVNTFASSPDEFDSACYAVARRNLVAFTDQVAQKVSTDHVTANCIFPGFNAPSPSLMPSALPVGGPSAAFSLHEKIAHCVRYLAESGRHVTGRTITIEGGCYL